ncbi:hypothetical protein ACA910_001612 [Epithemia clementina (nom. ined.)]
MSTATSSSSSSSAVSLFLEVLASLALDSMGTTPSIIMTEFVSVQWLWMVLAEVIPEQGGQEVHVQALANTQFGNRARAGPLIALPDQGCQDLHGPPSNAKGNDLSGLGQMDNGVIVKGKRGRF